MHFSPGKSRSMGIPRGTARITISNISDYIKRTSPDVGPYDIISME